LPGPYGVGDLGPAAWAWVDALARAGQAWWQILPLGPTGYGDSPYQCFSAFAGNPLLVSPDFLVRDGLIAQADLPSDPLPDGRVDFAAARALKDGLLARAWEGFQAGRAPALQPDFENFCAKQAFWLDDFGLFTALKSVHRGASWMEWPREYRLREPAALERARRELPDAVGQHRFAQFLFARQWTELREYARGKDVRLIGDLPIFVAGDSADLWAHPELFRLDAHGRPVVVAGVPPDYFSTTGQLWGNPLYDWDALRDSGYAWWVARVRGTLDQVDLVRLDHFRGFEAYWEVPAGKPTAEEGRWVRGPGAEFFEALRRELGGLPLIAEDLGVITPEVEALRERFGLPGMRILQFAFGGATEARFLPHNHERNTVVYTGTHDNDTTRGWFEKLTDAEETFFRRYVPGAEHDPAWALIRLAWESVAETAIAPLQDILDLGSEARMNRPGQLGGNWAWRFGAGDVTDAILDRLADLTEVYGRS
jgi:4-alpha-glucanotransferase